MLMPYYIFPLTLLLLDSTSGALIRRVDDQDDDGGLRVKPHRVARQPLGLTPENLTEPDPASKKQRNSTRKVQGNGTRERNNTRKGLQGNGTREKNNTRKGLQGNGTKDASGSGSKLSLDRIPGAGLAVKAEVVAQKAAAAAESEAINKTKHNKQQQSSETQFPTQIGTLLFVAGAHRISHVAGMSFHVFDIGFYLDKHSSLWHRMPTLQDILREAPGQSLLRLEISSGMVTGKRLASSINNIVKKHMTDKSAEQAMDVFVSMVQGGPALHIGSVVDIHVRQGGLKIVVDGVDLGGEVKHPSVAKAMLTTYLDDAPDIPVFKDAILANLGQGIKKYAFRGALDSDDLGGGGVPMLRTMVLVVVPCVVGIATLYWCVFHRRSTGNDPNRPAVIDK